MIDKETKNRVSELLCIQKDICNRLYAEIDEIMRGRGRTNKEIKESIIYVLDDRLR